MKKILIIASWYPNKENPVLGTYNREQAILSGNDFDIKVFTGLQKEGTSRLQKLINTIAYFLFGRVTIQSVSDFFLQPPEVISFKYSLGLNRFKKLNYKIQKSSYLKAFEKMVLKTWEPDLIHSQNTDIAGVIANEIKKNFSINYVNTDHHHLNTALPTYMQNDVANAMLNANQNLFVSEWQYRTYLLLNSKIKGIVVGNPVNENEFNFIETQNKSKNFLITYIGNGLWYKDTDTLMETIKLFYNGLSNKDHVEIKIIGFNNQLADEFKSMLNNFPWKERIVFIPPQSKEKIIEILQATDVFLSTSIFESFGIAPLEAMLCGAPVVTTSNGGVSEYFIEGVNGILCGLKDSKALAECLKDVYSGKIKFERDKVRNSVLGKYDNDSFKQIIKEIYLGNLKNG